MKNDIDTPGESDRRKPLIEERDRIVEKLPKRLQASLENLTTEIAKVATACREEVERQLHSNRPEKIRVYAGLKMRAAELAKSTISRSLKGKRLGPSNREALLSITINNFLLFIDYRLEELEDETAEQEEEERRERELEELRNPKPAPPPIPDDPNQIYLF